VFTRISKPGWSLNWLRIRSDLSVGGADTEAGANAASKQIPFVLSAGSPYTVFEVSSEASMHLVDLSHSISASMPVYPGTETPLIQEATTIAHDGFAEKRICLHSHTGTHIDAPGHILPGANTLDLLPIDRFMGLACVIDVAAISGARIEIAALEPHAATLQAADFVLLRSGWSSRWGSAGYFADFPILSLEAALWLSAFSFKGIGVDMISVDCLGSTDFPIHKTLFRKDMVIVENLTRLELLTAPDYVFSCMPLKFNSADGSPIRAFAFRT
jgi:kynurenine formamidase